MAGKLSKDFTAALDRLVAGKPLCSELQGKAFKVSATTVAIESGHARNNLYLEEYEDVLDAIRSFRKRPKKTGARPKIRDEVVASLRSEVASLKADLKNLSSENLLLFSAKLQAEERVLRLREKLRRNIIDLSAARSRRLK